MKQYVSLPYAQQPATSPNFMLNKFHDFSSYLFKIRFNIILPSTARSSNCSFSFRFASQNLNFTHYHIIRNYIHCTTEGIGNKTTSIYCLNNLHNVNL